jgi:hypothetical protein
MLIYLLGYLLLGLLLALPLLQLLRWLGRSSGLYTPQWKYLRPYVPAGVRAAARPVPTDEPTSTPHAH